MARSKARIEVEGLKQLIRDVGFIPSRIGKHIKAPINAFAKRVMDEAKELCPYDPERKSGTHLRDTAFIRTADVDINPTCWIGFGGPHANLVHEDIHGMQFGPSKMSTPGTGPKYLEKPFLAHKDQVERAIEEGMSAALAEIENAG